MKKGLACLAYSQKYITLYRSTLEKLVDLVVPVHLVDRVVPVLQVGLVVPVHLVDLVVPVLQIGLLSLCT